MSCFGWAEHSGSCSIDVACADNTGGSALAVILYCLCQHCKGNTRFGMWTRTENLLFFLEEESLCEFIVCNTKNKQSVHYTKKF